MEIIPHTLRIGRSCLKLRNSRYLTSWKIILPCASIFITKFLTFLNRVIMCHKNLITTHRRSGSLVKHAAFFLFFSFLFFSFTGRINAQPAPVIPSGDIDFRACQVSVYNSDDCYRLEFPFLFDYDGLSQPEPDEFAADQMLIQFTITGDGVFDLEATKALNANLPSLSYFSGYSTFHEQNPKVFYYLLHCLRGSQPCGAL